VRGDSLQWHSEAPQNSPFQTLYFGGGTPSLLGPKNLTTLITGLNLNTLATCGRESERGANQTINPLCSSPLEGEDSGEGFPLSKNKNRLAESTIELNPESATPEFLQTVKNLGFNRLSFGVQSLSDNELKSVGRIHTAKQALAAIKLAQELEFKAISADLIIGLPGQTWTSLHKSLQTLVKLGIQHLSIYCLSLEAGTPLANNPPPDLPSDDIQAQLFEETRTFLRSRGFTHYEISNFALPGYECLHNLNYWRGGEYLGLGPAAASHLNGKRFKNRANLDAYLQNPTGQIEDIEELSAKDKAAEEAMLRLRLLEEGLAAQVLTDRFGQENAHDIFTRLDKMVQEGLLIREGSRYRLEPSRIMTSNPIFARVLNC
jgi:oxygen-independent coproporphyrinogen-3 oxidase